MAIRKQKQPVRGGVARTPMIMQMEALECGAACLAMVLAYYGKWVPLEQVRLDCGVSRDGSNLKNLHLTGQHYGMEAHGYKMEVENLREQGVFPCIIHWNFNHFVVLNGFMAEPILKAEPEVTADKETVASVSGSIEMNHVTFRYEENTPYILKDLSLRIKAGEYVAIVGRTGCGKSTLVRLLLGFEKPEKGAVFYDRHDLNSLDPRQLRRHIGVVIQNGQLFQGDIFSNITISAPHLTLSDAWEAAETAGIAQDIREMPMGMQTMISEGPGGGVSGGQKQRLMIARAIAPKPRILIFDEATSALDNKTQKQVSDALDRMKCTRTVIAHRLSTVRGCDRILVMDQGAIIEEGTYEELIGRNGVFTDLVARQRLDVPPVGQADGGAGC